MFSVMKSFIPFSARRRSPFRMSVIAVAIIMTAVLSPGASAQDIYTKNNLPVPGTSYRLQHADALNVNVQPGGIDAVWDYSALKPIKGVVDSLAIVDAKRVSGSVPPEANVAVVNSTRERREYYTTLKPSLRSLGFEDVDIKALMGASPYDIDPIPVKVNSTYTTTVDGSIIVKARPDLRIERSGTLSFTPDGNGSIRLPGILPQRAIRLRWEEEYVDTVFKNDGALYTATTKTTRWVWMAENGCTEYLVIEDGAVKHERISEDPPKDSLIASVRYYTGGEVTSVPAEDAAALRVMPNPAADVITIVSEECRDRDVRVEGYTLIGEHVFGRTVHSADGVVRVDLPDGLCASQTLMLRIVVNGTVHTRFILLQR